ncbi:unnamed protein product [Urochloa humidicola]
MGGAVGLAARPQPEVGADGDWRWTWHARAAADGRRVRRWAGEQLRRTAHALGWRAATVDGTCIGFEGGNDLRRRAAQRPPVGVRRSPTPNCWGHPPPGRS